MRIVKIDAEIPDSSGLFFDLIKAGYEVSSVSSEKGSTLIHLEDDEDKDPSPVADLWIGKDAEKPSKVLMEERREVYEKHVAEKASRIAALRARMEVQNEVSSFVPDESYGDERPVQTLLLEKPKKGTWLKNLLKLW